MRFFVACAFWIGLTGAAVVPLPPHCDALHAGSPWIITTPDGPPFLTVRAPHPDTGEPMRDSTQWHGFAIDF